MIPTWLASIIARVSGQVRPEPAVVLPGTEFHDRRKFAAQSHHGYTTKRRSLSKVTGICLHQTACLMGERPSRYDGMGAHVGVTRAGKVIWLHDFDRRVVAANGWNDGTVSIEIDGLYAGVEGRPDTVWQGEAMTLTPAAVLAAQQTIRWICQQVPTMRVIVAHRQASASRRSDPGEAIWKSVAIPARAENGLTTPDAFTIGDGLPIPREWDPRSMRRY